MNSLKTLWKIIKSFGRGRSGGFSAVDLKLSPSRNWLNFPEPQKLSNRMCKLSTFFFTLKVKDSKKWVKTEVTYYNSSLFLSIQSICQRWRVHVCNFNFEKHRINSTNRTKTLFSRIECLSTSSNRLNKHIKQITSSVTLLLLENSVSVIRWGFRLS